MWRQLQLNSQRYGRFLIYSSISIYVLIPRQRKIANITTSVFWSLEVIRSVLEYKL